MLKHMPSLADACINHIDADVEHCWINRGWLELIDANGKRRRVS